MTPLAFLVSPALQALQMADRGASQPPDYSEPIPHNKSLCLYVCMSLSLSLHTTTTTATTATYSVSLENPDYTHSIYSLPGTILNALSTSIF